MRLSDLQVLPVLYHLVLHLALTLFFHCLILCRASKAHVAPLVGAQSCL